jgi:hypothetical protein
MAREYQAPEPLKDTDLMPNGKHKGKQMQLVPAFYLMYVYDNNICTAQVRAYIEDNMQVILNQAKDEGYVERD